MKVGVKIALGFCLVILVLLAMGGSSYYSAGNVETQMTAIQRSSQRVELVSEVDQSFTEGIMATRGYMVYGRDVYAKQALDKFDEAGKTATDLLQFARPEKKHKWKSSLQISSNIKMPFRTNYSRLCNNITVKKAPVR